ncbi:hypothetical protein HDU85_005834 [Gaertneriomyces sp. JEL0708]|nr:hypothetical protein HDU85_005834 [Gaertneriomyces sp. JEL0708]
MLAFDEPLSLQASPIKRQAESLDLDEHAARKRAKMDGRTLFSDGGLVDYTEGNPFTLFGSSHLFPEMSSDALDSPFSDFQDNTLEPVAPVQEGRYIRGTVEDKEEEFTFGIFGKPGPEASPTMDTKLNSTPLSSRQFLMRTDSMQSTDTVCSNISTLSEASLAIAQASTSEEYMPPFLRNIFGGSGASQRIREENVDPITIPGSHLAPARSSLSRDHHAHEILAPARFSRDCSGLTHEIDVMDLEDVDEAEADAENVWWMKKNFICDFMTTNVELYRWHTTHLKIEHQKLLAEARAAAGYVTNHEDIARLCRADHGLPTESNDERFSLHPVLPPELGLLTEKASGRLVMVCPAAFAVKARLVRHLEGKDPNRWTRTVYADEYLYTDSDGAVTGDLGNVLTPIRGSANAALEKKVKSKAKRKPFSFEKIAYVCSWPSCRKSLAKKCDLQAHMVGAHPILNLALEEADSATWNVPSKFDMVPITGVSHLASSFPDVRTLPPHIDVNSLLEAFRKAVHNVMVCKMESHIPPKALSEDSPPRTGSKTRSKSNAVEARRASIDIEAELAEFIAEIDMAAITREFCRWMGIASDVDDEAEVHTCVPGSSARDGKLKELARSLAALTGPTDAVIDYEIDPQQLPFPTISELMQEFGIVLQELASSESSVCADVDEISEKASLHMDLEQLSVVVEEWCASGLCEQLATFVVGATDGTRAGSAASAHVRIARTTPAKTPALRKRKDTPENSATKRSKSGENYGGARARTSTQGTTPQSKPRTDENSVVALSSPNSCEPRTPLLSKRPPRAPRTKRRAKQGEEAVRKVITAAALEREKANAQVHGMNLPSIWRQLNAAANSSSLAGSSLTSTGASGNVTAGKENFNSFGQIAENKPIHDVIVHKNPPLSLISANDLNKPSPRMPLSPTTCFFTGIARSRSNEGASEEESQDFSTNASAALLGQSMLSMWKWQ